MSTVSPKVSRSVFAGLIVSAILANVTAVDPAMLAWFGPWSPFIYGTAVTLLSGVAGYLTPDPVRDLGQDHLDAAAAQDPTAPGPRHLAS